MNSALGQYRGYLRVDPHGGWSLACHSDSLLGCWRELLRVMPSPIPASLSRIVVGKNVAIVDLPRRVSKRRRTV